MIAGADHDDVHITRQHARRIGNGFAAAKLCGVLIQDQHVAAELAHANLERYTGAGGRFLEDHGKRFASQRHRRLAVFALHFDTIRQNRAQDLSGDIGEVQEVPCICHIRSLGG